MEDLLQKIDESDWILIGIGEEWKNRPSVENELREAYQKLLHIFSGKNYFIITENTDAMIYENSFDNWRIVAPCGDIRLVQCEQPCCQKVWKKEELLEKQDGKMYCPECRGKTVENTVYAEHYVEAGYQKQWQDYTRWIQATLNQKLLILELGVSFKWPSVIRWPFERMVFINQKAFMYRINEKFPQLTEETAQKGCAVAENSMDFIRHL